ncbi:MAG TPA: hypothetical protein PL051_00750 [Candidatus Saccharibacteria bacterium]|nr:hypothetical protein [Candidatus Saccharibacteria bacterium]
MISWLSLSHHRHSGRLRPHEHTSYAPLGVLLVVVGFILASYSVYAASPGPEAGSIGLNGTVPVQPPTVAATISSPSSGKHFTVSPIEVAGTCTKDTLVEVFKNKIFAGSTPCGENGKYSVQADLLYGKNVLVARVYDVLNQAGPDSNKVTVYYDASLAQGSPVTSLNFSDTQLLLNTDAVFRGSFPNEEMTMPIEILGGRPPFAVNVEWGDSDDKVYARKDNVSFLASHAYTKPGTYQITVDSTDADGRVAFLTVAAVINGAATIVNDTSGTASTGEGLLANPVVARMLTIWPLYVTLVAIVVSFWLGERREKRVLVAHGALSSPR